MAQPHSSRSFDLNSLVDVGVNGHSNGRRTPTDNTSDTSDSRQRQAVGESNNSICPNNNSNDSLTIGMMESERYEARPDGRSGDSSTASANEMAYIDDEGEDGMHEPHERSSSHLRVSSANSISSDTEGTDKTKKKERSKADGDSRPSMLANRETRMLLCSKALFFFVVAIAAGLSSYAVWRQAANKEQESYERRFEDIANAVIAVATLNAEAVVKTYETVALQITAEELAANNQNNPNTDQRVGRWPFVEVRGFEARTAQIINFTDTTFVGLTPLVSVEQQFDYQDFVNARNREWIREDLKFSGNEDFVLEPLPFIYDIDNGVVMPPKPNKDGFFAPVMNNAPTLFVGMLMNYNGFNSPTAGRLYDSILSKRQTVIGVTEMSLDTPDSSPTSLLGTPIFNTLTRERQDENELVAFLTGQLIWMGYFRNLLPVGTDPIYVVIECSCDNNYTFLVEGPDVEYVGDGIRTESIDGRTGSTWDIERSEDFTVFAALEGCGFRLHVFPTQDFYDTIVTDQPFINAITVVITFIITAVVFVLYDRLVEKRQREVLKTADRSNAIVSSLFPANVRDRLMNEGDSRGRAGQPSNGKRGGSAGHGSLAAIGVIGVPSLGRHSVNETSAEATGMPLSESTVGISGHPGKPIADLFPYATVLFADIVGFTAWSSMREPTQVFELLEALYNTFDRIARRLGVFKVETIGDCYVAATGLPEANPDHAVVMVRFSKHCMAKMQHVVNRLAVTLGPDTGELSMRVGLHSGPVTAGVLRGDKSRFQLFGDTVNTAARLEQTSVPGKIQISQDTADELVMRGRQSWIAPREVKVNAKGKGELQTYWLLFDGRSARDGSVAAADHRQPLNTVPSPSTGAARRRKQSHTPDRYDSSGNNSDSDKNVSQNSHDFPMSVDRLSFDVIVEDKTVDLRDPSNAHRSSQETTVMELEVQWNVDVLKTMLQKILAMRYDNDNDNNSTANSRRRTKATAPGQLAIVRKTGDMVLDEVREVIALPQDAMHYKRDPSTVELSPSVVAQLKDFVQNIASMYRRNPFHNFSHASHVVQSTTKLMSRIVTANEVDYSAMAYKQKKSGETLHRYTYGITSDPMTQFACILAALVHDVDHPGVPNAKLVNEQSHLAKQYRCQSVAEQHSLDLAWELLMEPRYEELRSCIYSTQEELDRFRQLMVNVVMATDIIDKELGALRKARWEKAFSNKHGRHSGDGTDTESTNRMATIVIEHLIQASDVAHTMQHWHVYIKWNEKLFDEMYEAYRNGRAKNDPSAGWYEGELGFFDNYIIPLAKKLKECGVFGVSSDEYLNYAQANRKEWESRGREVVDAFMAKYQ